MRFRTSSLGLVASLFLLAPISQSNADQLTLGAVFSSAQSQSQSFLRFYNSGTSAGTATVTLQDSTTGQSFGQWTSDSIPAGAELQFPITTIENGIGIPNKPQYYTAVIDPNFSGAFQHVLWKPSDGTLTNLSTCAGTVTASISTVIAVHSSLLDNGYPSTIVITNTGVSAATVTLGIKDARDGSSLGTYTTASIPVGGQLLLPISTIEAAINVTPMAPMYHYNIRVESAFNGYLQQLVNNTQVAVITDMTAQCTLTATSETPTSSFAGVVSGADDEAGSLSITVQIDVEIASAPVSSAMKTPANSESQQAISSASGSYTPQNGSAVTLSGTYNSTGGALNLSGGGYSFSGALDANNGNQRFSGTYTSSSGSGGFAAERQSATNSTLSYCGSWSGVIDGAFQSGSWSFTVSSSGSVSGRTSNKLDGDSQNLTGFVIGQRALGSTTDGTTFDVSIGSSIQTGTFNSEEDQGNITASRC